MSFVNVTGAWAPPFACPLRRAGDDSTPATKNPDNARTAERMAWYCTGRFYQDDWTGDTVPTARAERLIVSVLKS